MKKGPKKVVLDQKETKNGYIERIQGTKDEKWHVEKNTKKDIDRYIHVKMTERGYKKADLH